MRHRLKIVGYLQVLLEEILPAIAMIFMTGLVCVAVVARYVFDHPLAYMNETVVLLTVWVVWLGAAGAVGKGMHVGVDLLLRRLTGRAQAMLDLIISIVVAIILVLLAWVGWSFALNTGLRLQVLGVSKTIMWLALPVGAALTAIRFAERAIKAAIGVRAGQYVLPQQFGPEDMGDTPSVSDSTADKTTDDTHAGLPEPRRVVGGI